MRSPSLRARAGPPVSVLRTSRAVWKTEADLRCAVGVAVAHCAWVRSTRSGRARYWGSSRYHLPWARISPSYLVHMWSHWCNMVRRRACKRPRRTRHRHRSHENLLRTQCSHRRTRRQGHLSSLLGRRLIPIRHHRQPSSLRQRHHLPHRPHPHHPRLRLPHRLCLLRLGRP